MVATGDNPQTVAVTTKATCGSGNEATLSFSNMPKTNIEVKVDSQVNGGTFLTITCTKEAGQSVGVTGGTADDFTKTVSNLLPGTYTCTILIDP